MKHSIIILLISLFLSFVAVAQEEYSTPQLPDSLVERLKENRGTDLNRAMALDDVIMFYFDDHRIVDATSFINELGDVANSIHDNYWIAKSHYYKALCVYYTYNAEFLAHANKALRIAETLRKNEASQLLLARIYLARSAYFFDNNLFPECQESINNGLKIAEKNGFHSLKHLFLGNLGAMLEHLEKHEDAIDIFKENLKNKFNLSALPNIAASYRELHQYDSAVFYVDSVISYVTKMEKMNGNDGYQLIRAYQIKALVFIDLNLWDQAIKSLDASKYYTAQYGDKSLFSRELLLRADALNGLGKYEQALKTIDNAIDIANTSNLINIEWMAVKLKSDILDNMKAYKREVETLRYFITLTDTLNNRENVEKVQIQKFQQETMAMEQQYELQQAAMRQRHRLIWLSFAFLFVVGALLTVIFMLNRKRKLETIAAVLDTRNREVTSKTLEQMHLNQVLQEVVTKLTYFANNPKGNNNAVDITIRDLKGLIDNGSAKDFDYFFTQVHPDFYKKLQADFPDLTPNDLRLCAYIKSNLNVKEVAELTGVSADSVKTARSRLRKKLCITDPYASLSKFLGKY
ncbi:MAG: tetratricopeptide repeat protein [Salinivirgaceae bacterium]